MTSIYEFLVTTKGKSYSQEQIEDHPASLLNADKYPTIPLEKKVKGNSRVHGDVDLSTQKIIIDMIITIGSRHHLSYKEIAYALLICKIESGFNPDAAAGTSSAAGLSQLTASTVDAIPKRSKKYLGVSLNMDGAKVFDATLGSYAIILAFVFNRALAIKWGFHPTDPKYWQLIYMLHHDGPGDYNNPEGEERAHRFKWRDAAKEAYKDKLLPKLEPLTKMLQGKVDTVLHLTGSDDAPVCNKDYVLATVEKSAPSAPTHVSSNKKGKPKLKIVKGKTNGQGQTQPINTGIGDEIIMLLLPKNYHNLFMSSKAAEIHKVKKGETLSKIAKDNDTTVAEIKKQNHITDINNIKIGQKIELPPPKQLRHKPATWALDEIMTQIGFTGGNIDVFSYVRNHTAKPRGSTSKSTKAKLNTVEIQTPVAAATVSQNNTAQPTQSQTTTNNTAGTVNVNGEALIYTFQDTDPLVNGQPQSGYTVFYDHHGTKIFSFTTWSKAASNAQAGATGPYSGFYTYTEGGTRNSICVHTTTEPPHPRGSAYGTTKIRTTDSRCRWVHGGGTGLQNPLAERQGWKPPVGCTRAQNIDVETLAAKIKDFKSSHPAVKIKYIRNKLGTYPK